MSDPTANTESTAATDTSTTQPETLGQRIRRLMGGLGLNQTSLAAKVGIDRTELNRTLNGKRQPRPDELTWIAEALGVSTDELLRDIDLPVALRETRDELQELARRVFHAESERDRARAESKALEEALASERDRWQRERAELVADAARVRTEYEHQLADARRHAAQHEQSLVTQLQVTGDDLANAKLLAAKNHRAAIALYAQVQELQNELAAERGKKIATGVLAGLAGALLGGAITGASTSAYSDDDDDDE